MPGSGMNVVRRGLIAVVAASLVSLGAAGCTTVQRPDTASLPSFTSDEDLREFLAPGGDLMVAARVPPPPAPPPPPPPPAPPGASPSAPAPSAAPQESVTVTASVSTENDSITNVQVAGVDEGGIVKVSGDYLVILRRGRLFTVSTADGDLRAVDTIDAYPPGASARWDWYDEMLVSGDLIVVIGYSYRRGGTEINRFRLAADGTLTFISIPLI